MKPLSWSVQLAFESQLCEPIEHSLVFSTCRLHLISIESERPSEITLKRKVIFEFDTFSSWLMNLFIDFDEIEELLLQILISKNLTKTSNCQPGVFECFQPW